MGLTPSRNTMSSHGRVEEEDSESSDDTDLATILQYLIRSGQVRILSDQPDYVAGPYHRPPQTSVSNLDNFCKTEVSNFTENASGGRVPPSITEMILRREGGRLRTGRGFSTKERCGINNRKLPVNMKIVDSYESKAFCGVYNKTGDRLLTASQDRFMRLYDSSNGCHFRPLSEIQGRDVGWSILDAAFSPDSSSIAYSSWSTNLHLVDLDSDLSTHTALPLVPLERKFCIFSLKFSSGGDEILCGANDGHIYIYNLRANRRTLKVEAHDEDVNTVAFADETSTILFSGSDDGLVKVWDRRSLNEQSPKPVGILAGHLDGVVYIDSREDSRHLISNSKDQSIKLWDMRKFSSEDAQEKTRKAVSLSRWDYRWQTAPRKLLNRKSNLKGDTSLATYRGHSVLQTQIRCHFSPAFTTGQRYIYTGCAFGFVVIYDVLTGEQVAKNKGHSSVVRDVSWHPYRNEIVSVSWDFSVMAWSQLQPLPPSDDEEETSEDKNPEVPTEPNSNFEGTVWNAGRRRSCRLASALQNWLHD
uniref:DDB1-and CUL4-associated factor 11 n=1 Tax=Lygus hesperus TaxID=30085 RepID=A0A0A9XLV9_LYGHE